MCRTCVERLSYAQCYCRAMWFAIATFFFVASVLSACGGYLLEAGVVPAAAAAAAAQDATWLGLAFPLLTYHGAAEAHKK